MQACTLYAVEGSYYAAKIRAYLQCKHIPFREVLSDRRVFAEVIVPRVGYPVVPVIVTADDDVLQDTAAMIDWFEARASTPVLVPATPRRRTAAALVELYADEWLKLPALHYRWYYDYEFAHRMMGENNDPQADVAEQRRVGARIAQAFRTWPEHLGASADTITAVEADFAETLRLLEAHFAHHAYLLGDAPTIADCALMGPLYAHIYHDPHSGALIRDTAPRTCRWIECLRGDTAHPANASDTQDTVPPSALALLRHWGRNYVPILATAMPLLQAWLGAHADEPIPRYVGRHRYTLGAGTAYAATGIRSIHPFEQWKVQRVLETCAGLPASARAIAHEFLREADAGGLLNLEFPIRLTRRAFRLVTA